MASTGQELTIRAARPEDRAAVIELCRASLGWVEGDPNEEFFAWKHDENPFGASPSWVAQDADGALAGLRVFLRWRFRQPSGGTLEAVRAVDTATHPDWQGKGIFTRLTLGAIPDLRELGTDLIFNTPNDKSRPGYLKMGWSEVGRVPVGVRVTSFGSVRPLLGARTAAEMWSEPCAVGLPAAEVLADADAVRALLDACVPPTGIVTDRSPEYLHWRYRFAPLGYRAVLFGSTLADGLVVFRIRRRGTATECAVSEVLAPRGASPRDALRTIARESGADYMIRCTGVRGVGEGFLPAPQLGPILTWRPIRHPGVPSMRQLELVLGDVELF